MQGKTIVVTGSSGFLGKHLKEALYPYQEQNKIFFLNSQDCNLLQPHQVRNMLRTYLPDIVIHAAAVCGGIKANSLRPADFVVDNLKMGINLFESIEYINREQFYTHNQILPKIRRVYTLGSVCAYPKYCPVPFKEDDLWNGYPEETNAPYGIAKRTLLIMGQAYRQQHGIGGAHLVPVNLYGEHDHFDLENSHVIPALINKFTTAVNNNQNRVYCWGTGSATREFLYAGDAAKAIVKAISLDLNTDLPINLGTGVDLSIQDLAFLIGKLTGFRGDIEFTGEVSDGQPKRRLDVSRAKELLGWEAQTKLEEGLVKTISWFRNEQGSR